MLRKAKARNVTGRACLCYENRDVLGADGRRSQLERHVLKPVAGIVREIFRSCAGRERDPLRCQDVERGEGPGATRAAASAKRVGAVVRAGSAPPRALSGSPRVVPHTEARPVGPDASKNRARHLNGWTSRRQPSGSSLKRSARRRMNGWRAAGAATCDPTTGSCGSGRRTGSSRSIS
jgi:hypothetical protein